jgi:hypothetical protein
MMTNAELAKRQERAARETLVIAETPEGFRVYAPTDPKRGYLVTGSAEEPACTCMDFQTHASDPAWRCKHILAVLGQQHTGNGTPTAPDPHEAEERRAIQGESPTPRKRTTTNTKGNGSSAAPQMLLKRSVSPDGRIDSLSVELSAPLENLPDDAIRARAEQLIELQSSIVGRFLSRGQQAAATRPAPRTNGQSGQPSTTATPGGGPAVPAQLMDVAGMDGKWGRRLFINVQVNGKTLRLFGTKEQLQQHVRSAGYLAPEPFCEGAVLNMPCCVKTKPSPDGRYTNVDQVLPDNGRASQPQPVRRPWQ